MPMGSVGDSSPESEGLSLLVCCLCYFMAAELRASGSMVVVGGLVHALVHSARCKAAGNKYALPQAHIPE